MITLVVTVVTNRCWTAGTSFCSQSAADCCVLGMLLHAVTCTVVVDRPQAVQAGMECILGTWRTLCRLARSAVPQLLYYTPYGHLTGAGCLTSAASPQPEGWPPAH